MSQRNSCLEHAVTGDPLAFCAGPSFQAKRVAKALGLTKTDLSRLAQVAAASVSYDDSMPEEVRRLLEQIGKTIQLVAGAFGGDAERTIAWFKARNPMLGDVSPLEMIRLGRHERLRKFVSHCDLALDEMLTSFAPNKHAGEAMIAGPVGAEAFADGET